MITMPANPWKENPPFWDSEKLYSCWYYNPPKNAETPSGKQAKVENKQSIRIFFYIFFQLLVGIDTRNLNPEEPLILVELFDPDFSGKSLSIFNPTPQILVPWNVRKDVTRKVFLNLNFGEITKVSTSDEPCEGQGTLLAVRTLKGINY